MKYYPVFMDVKGRSCLVVGAGSVGVRKARGLAECGADVTMVSEDFPDNFNGQQEGISCSQKKYETSDIEDRFLVFAATDNAELNRRIQSDALGRQILCNVADAPGISDFILPSTVERGDLVLAVSTSGTSPAMARTIKKDLARIYGPEYEILLRLMSGIRERLLAEGHAPKEHKRIFYKLIEKDISERVKSADEEKIDAVLKDVLGDGFNFRDLVSIKE